MLETESFIFNQKIAVQPPEKKLFSYSDICEFVQFVGQKKMKLPVQLQG